MHDAFDIVYNIWFTCIKTLQQLIDAMATLTDFDFVHLQCMKDFYYVHFFQELGGRFVH
jgi:hypothetical protein